MLVAGHAAVISLFPPISAVALPPWPLWVVLAGLALLFWLYVEFSWEPLDWRLVFGE